MYDKTPIHLLDYHHSMVFDHMRTDAHLRAIMHTVKPGDVVLEIGSGTGILTLFACLAGARHVYALEQGPMIEIARRMVRQNGFQESVTFVRDWSTNTSLPEPADVLITETIGNIGFDEGILGWVIDARKRLLAPGARIIPHHLELIVVPVESFEDYEYVDDWLDDIYSFDFTPAKNIAANNLHWTELEPEMFLSEPRCLTGAELGTVQSVDLRGETSFVITRDGLLHGIGGWFDSELIPGLKLSNSPPNPTPSWVHGFFPLERPIQVQAGSLLHVKIQTQANAAQWVWQVRLDDNKIMEVSNSGSKPGLNQNTLDGQLNPEVKPEVLNYKPTRSADAEVDLFILRIMDGITTEDDIARQVTERFPKHFSNIQSTQRRVQEICDYYDHNKTSATFSKNSNFKHMEVQKS